LQLFHIINDEGEKRGRLLSTLSNEGEKETGRFLIKSGMTDGRGETERGEGETGEERK
jgi:hypothetical protein